MQTSTRVCMPTRTKVRREGLQEAAKVRGPPSGIGPALGYLEVPKARRAPEGGGHRGGQGLSKLPLASAPAGATVAATEEQTLKRKAPAASGTPEMIHEAVWQGGAGKFGSLQAQDSKKAKRDKENKEAIGGMRRPAWSLEKVPGLRAVGMEIDQLFDKFAERVPGAAGASEGYGAEGFVIKHVGEWRQELEAHELGAATGRTEKPPALRNARERTPAGSLVAKSQRPGHRGHGLAERGSAVGGEP